MLHYEVEFLHELCLEPQWVFINRASTVPYSLTYTFYALSCVDQLPILTCVPATRRPHVPGCGAAREPFLDAPA